MNKQIIKVKNYVGGIESLFFIVYSTLIFSLQAYINSSIIGLLRSIFVCFVISFFICPKVLKFVREAKPPEALKQNDTYDKRLRIILYILPFAILLYQYIIYYPGGFSADTFHQLEQVYSNEYIDWHPVLHTVLFIKLPLLLTNGWVGSISLFQIILFSLTVLYTTKTIIKYTDTRIAALTIIYILVNPLTLNLVLFVWKDIAFAMGALLLCDFAINILFSEGKWIKKSINISSLILVTALTTLTRHNAILFTAFYILALFFYISKKQTAIIIFSVVLIICGIKGPLYNALNVQAPGQRTEETMGVALSVIDAVAAYSPNSLDEDTRAEIYRITPQEALESDFDLSGYNSVKWNEKTNNAVIEEYGTEKLLSLALNCFKANPEIALKALVNLTSGVYTVNDSVFSLKDNTINYLCPAIDYRTHIKQQGIPALQRINYLYTTMCIVFLPYVFVSVGTLHLLLLLIISAKYRLREREKLKRVLFILPMFAYNFGTMLFLSSSTDITRFFYYSFIITPLLLIILLISEKQKHNIM